MLIKLGKIQIPANLTIVPVYCEEQIDKVLKQKLSLTGIPPMALADFKNQLGQSHILYIKDTRIMLLGLGEKKNFNSASWRTALHTSMLGSKELSVSSANLLLPQLRASQTEQLVELTGFALTFSNYQFDDYKKDKQASKLKNIEIITTPSARLNKALERGIAIGEASNTARDLSNHPGNIATPTHLAEHAKKIAKEFSFTCKTLGPAEIAKEKMGLITGVAKGSDEPSRFIILEYLPAGRQAAKKAEPIVLIGKGLTFDSGGISIKPADKMEEMKYDMCGAATVLGIFEAVAKLKLPVHLVGIIPSAENLVSGQAVKPGDILIAKDGTSVEIINTDAEGRLVLADAINYTKEHYQPKFIIDYATLTGAILVALGDQITGYFSNTEKYEKLLKKSAETSAEQFWPLPMPSEYKEQLKSMFADIKNVGEKGSAGASTAALFLEHFIGQTPWVHMDIAGTAWTTRPRPNAAPGATAWGVYLTVDFLRNL